MSSINFEAAAGMCVSAPPSRARTRLLEIDAEAFRRSFNRAPFPIRHNLADHPLFALPRLIELSRRLPAEHVIYNSGEVSVDTRLYHAPRTALSVEETIHQIEDCRSWMVLKFVEQDPQYHELLDQCLDEIQTFSEGLAPGMYQREGFIFISSPNSVTPFHIDPEYNFLLQVRGRKKMNVLNGLDQSVLSERQLENYYASGDLEMDFREEYRRAAHAFELTQGMGVHVPVTAPHWVENGGEVSISFSITFRTPASERRGMVYAVNAHLRRLGLSPAPFGRSSLRDTAKFHAFRVMRRAGKYLPAFKAQSSRKY